MRGMAHIPFTESKHTPASDGFGHGWCRELNRAWGNGYFAVMSRELNTAWGRVTHLFIRDRHGSNEITWADKQTIKNQIAGKDKTAIEVFPTVDELVDGANSYHLWVLHDVTLPFSLKDDREKAS
jgi:hypothetical protein